MNFSNSQAHYILLKGVKAELSPNYQTPELVSLPYEYVPTNDSILNDLKYNFEYEIKYLEEYKKQKEEEEQKRIQELKAKAPGLTDKVLEPVRLNSQADSISNLNKESNNTIADNNNNTNINNDTTNSTTTANTTTNNNNVKENNKSNIVSEFEDVPPLDPWDKSKTNTDELLQLQLGMSDMSYSQQSTTSTSTNNMNSQHMGSPRLNSPRLNSPRMNHSNIPIGSNTSSPSLSAQTSMSYTTTSTAAYHPPVHSLVQPPPPVQGSINPSSTYPPMNQSYRPPVPPKSYPYPPYGGNQYGSPGPNPTELPSNYVQGMPQPYYAANRSFSTSTPPPVPTRPNPQDFGSPAPPNKNDVCIFFLY